MTKSVVCLLCGLMLLGSGASADDNGARIWPTASAFWPGSQSPIELPGPQSSDCGGLLAQAHMALARPAGKVRAGAVEPTPDRRDPAPVQLIAGQIGASS